VSEQALQRAPLWWRGAVLYEICPRSFSDTNRDGVGDLRGILDRLPYLVSLGVDGLWISPFFKSPMEDFGYDVEDHCEVDPLFGSLEDFDRLLETAHRAGLKVIVDLVLSHTSRRHPWFAESRRSRDNPKADWYVWADPKPDGTPPNNWLSMFGGPAWSWEPRREQYYFHNFLPTQPDLDLHDPKVQNALLDVCRFWLERGVDGFRLDACNFYTHDRSLRDNPPRPPAAPPTGGVPPNTPYNRQLHVHDKSQPETLIFLRRLQLLAARSPGCVLLGEIADDHGMGTVEEYAGPDGPLHTAYSFLLLGPTLDPGLLVAAFDPFHDGRRHGWPTWAFSNHDVVRATTRWGGENPSSEFAKTLIALLCSLRGTVLLYQGEELGLPQAVVPYERIRDPFGLNFYPDFQGRDGCRTPMPWDDALPHAGFSDVEPWLPVAESHLALSVTRQRRDPRSVLNFTRSFLSWRRGCPPLIEGDIAFCSTEPGVLVFRRMTELRSMLVALNLENRSRSVALPAGRWQQVAGHGLAHGTLSESGVELPPYGRCFADLVG
jgi:alpha-glucosidase